MAHMCANRINSGFLGGNSVENTAISQPLSLKTCVHKTHEEREQDVCAAALSCRERKLEGVCILLTNPGFPTKAGMWAHSFHSRLLRIPGSDSRLDIREHTLCRLCSMIVGLCRSVSQWRSPPRSCRHKDLSKTHQLSDTTPWPQRPHSGEAEERRK